MDDAHDDELVHAEDLAPTDERRRIRGATLVAATFLVLLLALVLVQAALDSDDDVDDTAMSTEFALTDGTTTTLQAFEGTPVVVNFFASWCAPCIREMPDFEEVHQERGGEVTFLGINVQDRSDALADLLDRTGVTYEIGLDPRGDLLNAFGATVMPTTVLVTAEGRLAALHGGELSADALRALIDEELTG